jgi:protein ImuB
MTVTHAQSLIPELTVVNAAPEEDEAALIRLALWCIKYSPVVTAEPPDGIFIDVAGSAHLFQGETVLIHDLCQRLNVQGIAAKAALADTAGCAWALARFGEAEMRRTANTEKIGMPKVSAARLAFGVRGKPPRDFWARRCWGVGDGCKAPTALFTTIGPRRFVVQTILRGQVKAKITRFLGSN